MTTINEWAARHGVSADALADLQDVLMSAVPDVNESVISSRSEAAGQQQIRIEGAKQGVRLWRNNVGAYVDEYGNMIRYGLANESKAMNTKVKSSDLIGITPMEVKQQHVGATLGIFTAIDCKRAGWIYKGTPHEQAQLSFHQIAIALGAFAQFATGPEDVWES